MLRSLSDASLAQPVVPGGRTLGFLAWHITGAIPVMTASFGLDVEKPGDGAARHAADIAAAYERTAASLLERVQSRWTDEKLVENVSFYGRPIPAGVALEVLIRHQTHHRGQMTVLMRQAGVPVPGVYGPSKEEWAALGQAARE